MKFADSELSQDGFLGGKLHFWQPKQGYRAASDAVFLAAALPARSGQSVLELGCGAGVALGCLCFRVRGLDAFGLEIQQGYALLAQRNFAENQLFAEIITGDLADVPISLKSREFDHVLANPPYFGCGTNTAPRDLGKRTAHVAPPDALKMWLKSGLKRVKPGGMITVIHRAETLPELLTILNENMGDIKVLPITSRHGRSASRVIVQARKNRRDVMRLLAPLVVHNGARHGGADDGFSEIAASILQNGAALPIG